MSLERRYSDSSCCDRVQEAGISRIEEACRKYGRENMSVLFDASKESVVVLQLLRTLFDGKVIFPVVFVDTNLFFREVYEYVESMKSRWNLNLITLRGDTLGQHSRGDLTQEQCCQARITEPFCEAVCDMGLKAVLIGNQVNLKPWTNFFHADSSGEEDIAVIDVTWGFGDYEIWSYIRKYDVPYCGVYDMGYKVLGCKPCMKPAAFSGGLLKINDREDLETLEKLKSLGYL